jgi:hypothetical protein
LLAAVAPYPANATLNLVTNGSFEILGNGITTPQKIVGSNIVSGWSTSTTQSSSYDFLFFTSTGNGPATLGSTNTEYSNTLKLYGPDSQYISPDGGNVVGMDSAYQVGAISQIINGLTVGASYAVSFDWAGAQQSGFNGSVACGGNPDPGTCTTDKFQVSLGSQTLSTQAITVANHGFTGWLQQTLIFTATAASETLAFLPVGTPNGAPPFALLDGVSMTQVPEPATAALMLSGMVALGAVGWRGRKRAEATE